MKVVFFLLFSINIFAEVPHWNVDEMKKLKAASNWTFDVGENWVTDYLRSGGSIRNVTGLKKSILDFVLKDPGIEIKVSSSELPSSFDWRTEHQGGMQPIKNQGSCGSCWAFSVVATVESLFKIKGIESEPNLAEQTMVSTCSNAGDCNGGYMHAFNYVKTVGLPDEEFDPYQARNSKCKKFPNSVELKKIINWKYITNNNGSPTVDQIKKAIMDYGPVSVTVNGSFSSYKSGIYNNCRYSGTNHMVNIEGWNDDGQYWIMRNSWGTNWGEQGYMRIRYTDSRGRRCNNIGESVAVAVME